MVFESGSVNARKRKDGYRREAAVPDGVSIIHFPVAITGGEIAVGSGQSAVNTGLFSSPGVAAHAMRIYPEKAAAPARCSSLAGKVRRVFWRMPETLV